MAQKRHLHEVTSENEKKTLFVIIVTFVAMLIEITYGYITNSMALLADGYHMGTHVLALGLTYVAYILIRKYSESERFPSGPNKIGTLAAYTSSIFLGMTGLWIIFEAFERLVNPLEIMFNEAIFVAIIGLLVNAICICIMENKHHDCHSSCVHGHDHHCGKCEDYNFKAAYYHILADALTSILAIIALLVGKYFHFIYLDSFSGIVGGFLIIRWSCGLLKNTVKILIDMKG